MVLAALYLGRSLFAPVCIAIFIVAVAWPLQRVLQRRLPRVLAMVITVVATAAVVVVMSSLVLWGLSRATQWAIANAAYKRQRRNPGVTEIVKIPNRGHALTIDHGWQEVAQTALDFVKRFVPAKPR